MFPRKTVLLLLLATILVSLAIRYPLVEHERFQTDSYFIHTLSNDIVREGRAAWTFNALSYVGYYPSSYPSGAPFVLAELSLLTGLGLDVCILLIDGSLAALFCLIVFCLSREFVHRVEFALLAAFLAVIAPRFVDTTYWVGSARGMEVVLITLLVFVAFRAGFSQSKRLLLVSGLVAFACFAVHHMAVLIILYGIGFVLAELTVRYLPKALRNRGKRLAITTAASLGVIATIVVLNYFEILGNSFETIGETGFFDFKIPVATLLGNLIVSYAHQIGLVLVVAALGVVAFLRAPQLFVRRVFPFALLLVFVPVLGSSLYVSMLLSPFVAIVGVLWFQSLKGQKKRRIGTSRAVIAILIVFSLTFTVWSVDRWNQSEQPSGDTVQVGNEVFNDAAYLRWNGNGLYTMSNTPLGVQLGAYSDASFLGSGIQAAINRDVTKEDVENNLSSSTAPFPGNLYTWLVYKDDSFIYIYVFALMTTGVSIIHGDDVANKFHVYATSHSNVLIVVDNNWPTEFASPYGIVKAPFLSEVRNCQAYGSQHEDIGSYCSYESQRVTIYMVQLPLP
jgi:hypothetical protein